MEIFLIILGAICLLVGLVGTIVPVLPGVPLGYVGLLLLQATDKVQFSTPFLLIWAAVVVVIQLLDTFLPVWTTKWSGGSKAGVWGSTIGLLIGFFFAPFGIIAGPFVEALKSGAASLLGFLCGTIAKLVAVGLMIYYFVVALL